MCILTRIARRPPREQWQCQGRNGTSSVTAFVRRPPRVRATTFRRPVGRLTADPAVEVAADRRPPGLSRKIAVAIESMSRGALLAATVPARRVLLLFLLLLQLLFLSLSLAPSPPPHSLRFARAPRPHPFRNERKRECARACYASRASSCGSLTGTWWNEPPSNEKSETAIRPRDLDRRVLSRPTRHFLRARQRLLGSRNPRESATSTSVPRCATAAAVTACL